MSISVPHKPELVIICLDGMRPPVIDRMIDSGRMCAFTSLVNNGCRFKDFRPVFPTITPVCWAAFATGAPPSENNITCANIHVEGDHPAKITPSYLLCDYSAENLWDCASKVGKKSLVMSIPSSTFSYAESPADENLTIVKSVVCETNHVQEFEIRKDNSCDNTICDGTSEWTAALHFNMQSYSGRQLEFYAMVSVGNGYVRFCGDGEGISPSPTAMENGAMETCGNIMKSGDIITLIKRIEDKDYVFRVKLIELSDGSDYAWIKAVLVRDIEDYAYPAGFAREIAYTGLNTRYADERLFSSDIKTATGRNNVLKITRDDLGQIYEIFKTAVEKRGIDIAVLYYQVFDNVNHAAQNIIEGFTTVEEEIRSEICNFVDDICLQVDDFLGRIMDYCGKDTTIVVLSDHGAVGYRSFADIYGILEQAGLLKSYYDNGRRVVDWGKTLAYPISTCHIYVNLKGREPCGIVPPEEYDAVRNRIIRALWQGFYDDESMSTALAFAVTNEEAEFVGLGGKYTGDVVYGLKGEYLSRGIHGSQITTARSSGGGDIRPALFMAGKGIKKGAVVERSVSLCDVVPTLCYLHGYPMPDKAQGAIIYQVLEKRIL